VRVSGRIRRLSGELDGVRLDLVWARREGMERELSATGRSSSAYGSGARFTARPIRGELDPDAVGPVLDALREDRRAELHFDRIVWKPSGAETMGAAGLERAARLLVAAVHEAAAGA
jgi:hypothetical protein